MTQKDAYELGNWFDCEPEFADPSGNCNMIFGYASNTLGRPVQSFSELIYPAGAPVVGTWCGVGPGIDIRIVEGGIVHITDNTAPEGKQVFQGSWEYRTVHDEQIMMLTLPERFTPRFWDSGQQILAVRNGYVRRGTFMEAGTPETIGEIQFNETAFNDIKDNSTIL